LWFEHELRHGFGEPVLVVVKGPAALVGEDVADIAGDYRGEYVGGSSRLEACSQDTGIPESGDDARDAGVAAAHPFGPCRADHGVDPDSGSQHRDDVAALLPDLAANAGENSQGVGGLFNGSFGFEQRQDARLLVNKVEKRRPSGYSCR
jgi:hypothetical protein